MYILIPKLNNFFMDKIHKMDQIWTHSISRGICNSLIFSLLIKYIFIAKLNNFFMDKIHKMDHIWIHLYTTLNKILMAIRSRLQYS